MFSPQKYARVTPRLRSMYAGLIKPEVFRELISTSNLDDAFSALRDTPYIEAIKAKTPDQIQSGALTVYLERARKIEYYAPKEALALVQAFYREEEAKDALVIMKAVFEGRSELPMLPTMNVEGSLAYRVRREPESLVSLQRLVEFFEKTWFKPYAREAYRIATEVKSSDVFLWYPLTLSVLLYSEALRSLPGMTRREVEKILCPYLLYKLVASILNAKAINIPVRELDKAYGELNVCGFKWRQIRGLYERDPSVQELFVSLRDVLPQVELDTKKDYQQALEEAKRQALRTAYKNSVAAFNGYPFTPALLAAFLMLAKIEAYDLITILTSIALRLGHDEYRGLIVII